MGSTPKPWADKPRLPWREPLHAVKNQTTLQNSHSRKSGFDSRRAFTVVCVARPDRGRISADSSMETAVCLTDVRQTTSVT
jgi:hypothetical protein